MQPRHTLTKLAVLSFLVLLTPTAISAQAKGFKGVVEHIEKNYHGKRTHIPFLGLANFVVKIVRPAGVKSFKLAVFEEQDFLRAPSTTTFDAAMRSLMPKEWLPLVRVSSRRGEAARTFIYAKPAGKDMQLMTVVLEPREAVVIEVRLNPDAVAKFLDNPRVMGVSLAGDLRGRSSSGLWSGSTAGTGRRVDYGGSSDIGRRIDPRDEAGYTLAGTSPPAPSPEAKVRPAIQNASGEEADPGLKPEAEKAPSTDSSGIAVEVPTANASKDAIRIDTQLVNLNVKAMDRSGKPLTTLLRDEFVVYEDGVKQEITYFDPVDAPINLVLLLDLSGSTSDKREVMLSAAKNFVDSLSPRDRVAVAAFTREYYVVSDFTTDRAAIKERLEKLRKVRGGTAFYDAMWTTLDLLSRINNSRKAIVVLTDGVDEQLIGDGVGSKRSFDTVLDRVAEEDVTIYPIYLDSELSEVFKRLQDVNLPARARERIRERSLRPRETAQNQLEKLAEETAGSVFKAEDEKDLDGVYQRVAAELRLLYSLAYSPENASKDGKFRKINLEVKREGVVARTRRGYVAR